MQRIVMTGLLVRNKKEWKQITDEFNKERFDTPKLIKVFKTLPGNGGEGGRSDVIVDVYDVDVCRLAIHPFHLGGLFSWAEDYIVHNRDIVPKNILRYFAEDKKENDRD